MRIAKVEIAEQVYAFPDGPYVMSHAVQTAIHTRILRLTAEDGTWGIGETSRRSYLKPGQAEPVEDRAVRELPGLDFGDLPALLSEWHGRDKLLEGLVFGIETAMLDRIGRVSGMPLSAVLGGPASGVAPAYLSLSSEDPAVMGRKFHERVALHPAKVVQAKLGIDDPETDLARVSAVLDRLLPGQLLLADFNGGHDRETALRIVSQIRDPRLVWEDPCLSLEDNAAVARQTGQPVQFDMCVSSLSAVAEVLNTGAAHSVVVKPPFIGGLRAAMAARDMVAAAAIPVRVDGPWSGPIAAAAMVALAIGAPEGALLSSADLTGPLEAPGRLVSHPDPGSVAPPHGPGLGDIPAALLANLQSIA